MMLKKSENIDTIKYFEDGKTWEQEIIANALQSRNRAWLLSFLCMAIAVLSLITLLLVLPLKTFEPYIVSLAAVKT